MELLSPREDSLYLRRDQGGVDGLLSEAYMRLHFQMQLFQPSVLTLMASDDMLPSLLPTYPPDSTFPGLCQAWAVLEQQIKQAIHLGELARSYQSRIQKINTDCMAKLQRDQKDSLTSLSYWLEQWEKFSRRHLGPSCEEQKANWLLRCFHLMGIIMLETCLHPDDESIYDLKTDRFVSLAIHLIKLRNVSLPEEAIRFRSPDQHVEISRSIVDVGVIQPLYYLATKCRVHRLRVQAIRLLGASAHREGIWESRTAALVARKIMELEERGLHTGEEGSDDFPVLEYPVDPAALSLPLPLKKRRLRRVEVDLLGEPTDTIVLRYETKTPSDDDARLTSIFDVRLRQWKDFISEEGVIRGFCHILVH